MAMCKTTLTIDGIPVRIQHDETHVQPSDFNLDAVPGYALTDCSLTEELLKPIEFQFTLRRISLKKTADTKSFSVVGSLLGKAVYCRVVTSSNKEETSEYVFTGTIVSTSMKGLSITCVAQSASFKLQGPAKSRCFVNKKISDIVNSVAVKITHKEVVLQDEFESYVFPYIVQYNESDYDFLIRLAKRFGAFLYEYVGSYGESRLVFGKLPSEVVIDLTDEKKSPYIAGASYQVQSGDPNYYFVAHDYEKNLDLESPGEEMNVVGAPRLSKMEMAVKASSQLNKQDAKCYIDYPNGFQNAPATDALEVYNLVKLFSEANRMVTCKFISYLFDVQVGNVVKINNQDLLVVTSSHLTWDCNGSPQNEITAFAIAEAASQSTINADGIFAPYLDFNTYPKSSAQRAVVINNIDPLKMGRVQVQFAWQKDISNDDKKILPWIRIAQPYGGGKKDKEQGCYILPEIGEEVMVGFEHDNLEKPYVIGALYHDSDTADNVQMPDPAWVETDQANKNNEVKAFRTKKGHTIEFHDVDGDDNYGFIRIYGKNQSEKNYDIYLSSNPVKNGDAFYKVNGPKEDAEAKKEIGLQEYEAKELRIMVRSNGGDIVLDAGDGDIIMNAKNIRVNVAGNRTTAIQDDDIVSIGGNRLVDAGNDSLMLRGKQTVMVHGELDAEYKAAVNLVADRDLKADVKRTMKLLASDLEAEASQTAKVKTNSGIELNGGMKVDIQATNFKAEGRADATLKGTNITVDALVAATVKATDITLDSEAGTRKGLWADM